jgi:hypothetical protein
MFGMRTIFLTVRALFPVLGCTVLLLCWSYPYVRLPVGLSMLCINSLAEPCYRVYYVGRVLLYINNPKPPSFQFNVPLLLSRVSF